MTVAQRRFLIPAIFLALIAFLTTVQYFTSLDSVPTSKLKEIASSIGEHVPGLSQHPEDEKDAEEATNSGTGGQTSPEKPSKEEPPAELEQQFEEGGIGKHFHWAPTSPTPDNSGIPNCEYPILIHVTPDEHCTGALALYGSIVRNVLLQPKRLQSKTCVHFTYVDSNLTSVPEMYKWPSLPNPYTSVPDCKLLDTIPAYNELVPVRFQALPPIEKPATMETRPHWLAALNKVHSWAFDLYPRILLLDADSILVTGLADIFDENDPWLTIAGGVDQYPSCHDRSRLNGGMILLRPSRYFHTIATELLYDPKASCLTGNWQQSEQELLNCVCGYGYKDRPVPHPLRPEFKCKIMPMYNSVWPRNYACSDANVQDMRSIHFTASPKPWKVKEELLGERFDTGYWKCVRDAAREGDNKAVQKCGIPDQEVTRRVKMEGHFVVPT